MIIIINFINKILVIVTTDKFWNQAITSIHVTRILIKNNHTYTCNSHTNQKQSQVYMLLAY